MFENILETSRFKLFIFDYSKCQIPTAWELDYKSQLIMIGILDFDSIDGKRGWARKALTPTSFPYHPPIKSLVLRTTEKSNLKIEFNSRAADVPELCRVGKSWYFDLARLSVNCYVKMFKNIPLMWTVRILKILSGQQDHCGSHNNFLDFFRKIINLMVFTYFFKFLQSSQPCGVERHGSTFL